MTARAMTGAFCASLPSSTSAYDLVVGRPMGLPNVILSTLGRATLIAAGVYVFQRLMASGDRRQAPEDIAKNAVAGAVGIEVFVLAYIAWRAHARKR